MNHLRNRITAAVLAACCISSLPASAEETISYALEPDTVYAMDLDGDGKKEELSFRTYTQEDDDGFSHAVLVFTVNGNRSRIVMDNEWSYFWQVSRCPLGSGSTALVVSSTSDNDWTCQTLLIAYDSEVHSFYMLARLDELSRQSDENSDNLLSGWARAASVTDVSEDTFTLAWCDVTNCAGNLIIPVTYQMSDDQLFQLDEPCQLDSGRAWTVWHPFDTVAEPGSNTTAFHVSEGEIVHLTEILRLDGRYYLKCINSQEQEGWLPDAEESVFESTADTYRCGYFEEAIYAG